MSSRLSDYIEEFIRESLRENDGIYEFNRNLMASYMNCVPSQISYVLATRFTNDNGYLVTSRRGGKGSIEIRQIFTEDAEESLIEHIIKNLPEQMSEHECQVCLDNLLMLQLLDQARVNLIKTAVSATALQRVDNSLKKYVRADIVKNILLEVAYQLGDF